MKGTEIVKITDADSRIDLTLEVQFEVNRGSQGDRITPAERPFVENVRVIEIVELLTWIGDYGVPGSFVEFDWRQLRSLKRWIEETYEDEIREFIEHSVLETTPR